MAFRKEHPWAKCSLRPFFNEVKAFYNTVGLGVIIGSVDMMKAPAPQEGGELCSWRPLSVMRVFSRPQRENRKSRKSQQEGSQSRATHKAGGAVLDQGLNVSVYPWTPYQVSATLLHNAQLTLVHHSKNTCRVSTREQSANPMCDTVVVPAGELLFDSGECDQFPWPLVRAAVLDLGAESVKTRVLFGSLLELLQRHRGLEGCL